MESHVSGSIKFKLWIIFICTIDVVIGEENDTQVSNVTVSNKDTPMMKFLAFILFIAHVAACSSFMSEDKNTESLSVSI